MHRCPNKMSGKRKTAYKNSGDCKIDFASCHRALGGSVPEQARAARPTFRVTIRRCRFSKLSPFLDQMGVAVKISHSDKIANASSRLPPQASSVAWKPRHTSGRLGCKKIAHLFSLSKCRQRTIAGLPKGCKGIAEEIDGAIQQAPQPIRHCIE